jgi:NAD(P)H-dependent FMN reductase
MWGNCSRISSLPPVGHRPRPTLSAFCDNLRVKNLLIVYHTMTQGTLQMAEAAAAGARAECELKVSLVHAASATAGNVLEADGFIFATPENLAAMAGQMKDFFDRTYYSALDRVAGKPYAILVCAGSDGRNAAQQIDRIATGWRLKPVAPPLIVCTHAQTPEEILESKNIPQQDLERCRDLGATLAAGIALGVF